MKRDACLVSIFLVFICVVSAAPERAIALKFGIDPAQVPTWSSDDLNFFLHGSMGTEIVPEAVLRAFIRTYPDLFPSSDLSHLGLIPDEEFGWRIGLSRKRVGHLGNLSALGINCASCHFAQINSGSTTKPLGILGVTSHFDVETFFGSVLVATFRTSDPVNMEKFLEAYLDMTDQETPGPFSRLWERQEQEIIAAIKADPFGANNVASGALHPITPADLNVAPKFDLAVLSHNMLKLFHNMRAALHVLDQPPEKTPPASGPGRNDAFGLLAASLLNAPQPYSPIKFGLVWNVDQRTWVHWDGNTKSPIARNLLASLGLGAPMHGKHGDLEFAQVKRQTDLSEKIRTPHYPLEIDKVAAKRGAAICETNCNSCHGGTESDKRLYSVAEIGTDPHRAEMFTEKLAGGFNKFLAELETEGYQPPKEFGVRSTGKYFAATLSGVWARSPYLHNGSVRTMEELLTSPADRATMFHRGSREYDSGLMGYTDAGPYVFDTSVSGNSNSGHDYGTTLSAEDKHALIEYLKTL